MKETQITKVQITEEYFDKYEKSFEFDKSEFDTEQEIEVRIPFTGYYSLKVTCKNPQIAMAEVLKMNRDIGLLSIEGTETEIEDTDEDETYAITTETVKCFHCGSTDLIINSDSPDDRPYVIVTEYKCKECNNYWYHED